MAAAIRLSQQHSCSLDHLVGAREQCRWHLQAQRLGSLEIDHQLILGRCLHRKIGRLLPLEDAVHVASSAALLIEVIGTIRNETADVGVNAVGVDCGQAMLGPAR